ncbi:MAG: Rpn family recombination-promoting nuclease/putative transposase [Polyangiales bacterium]
MLVSLLTAVMRPSSPIAVVKVMHPEVTKEHAEERGLVLDLLVQLADGRRVNVEMQCDMRHALPERWLFHWARLFTEGISRGEPHKRLTPVVCIVFLDGRIGPRFHAIHRLLEVHDHTQFSDALEIHTVALPRVAESEGDELLSLWARFLRVSTEAELQSLAAEDPIMTRAKEALERLSSDPEARALYEARLYAEVTRMVEREADEAALRAAQEQMRAAEEQTRAAQEQTRDALRVAIEALCDAFDIEIDPARRARLDGAKAEELTALLARLRTDRAWP